MTVQVLVGCDSVDTELPDNLSMRQRIFREMGKLQFAQVLSDIVIMSCVTFGDSNE